MRDNIDAVVTEKPFFCGTCHETKEKGPVIRRIEVAPDFCYGEDVPGVDTLECLACHLFAVRAVRDLEFTIQPDEAEEYFRNYTRRYPQALS